MNTLENYPGYLSDFWNFDGPEAKNKKIHYVLVVEDSEMDFLLLAQIFKTRKPNVFPVHVESVDEAKVILQKEQDFDLIICDQFLPGTDTGISLWRFCQEKYPQIPFMMTSASNLTSFFETTNSNLAPPFLQKPYTIKEAWNKVEPFVEDDHSNHLSGDPISNESKRVIAAVFSTGIIVILLLLFYGSFLNRPRPVAKPPSLTPTTLEKIN